MQKNGADRVRTDDSRLAKPVLYQLSYSPNMVGLGRLELPTSRLSGVRSNQLSYRPQHTKKKERGLGAEHLAHALVKKSGGDLLSHTGNHAVPSAQEGLTSEFEMESGVAPPL